MIGWILNNKKLRLILLLVQKQIICGTVNSYFLTLVFICTIYKTLTISCKNSYPAVFIVHILMQCINLNPWFFKDFKGTVYKIVPKLFYTMYFSSELVERKLSRSAVNKVPGVACTPVRTELMGSRLLILPRGNATHLLAYKKIS